MLEAKDGVCFSFAISFRVYSLELGYSLYSLWPWEGIGGKPSSLPDPSTLVRCKFQMWSPVHWAADDSLLSFFPAVAL